MFDDTDFHKTGKRMENIGRVYSHLKHRSILGFKALFLGITDGVSQMLLDFAILGEKGKRGNFGMSAKEPSMRHVTKRNADTPLDARVNKYATNKIDLTIEMIRRAISHKISFRYVLADSWFTCTKIIKFIHGRRFKCDYLGMIKIGDKGTTKYRFERKELNALAIIKLLDKRGEKKYSRKLRCWYMSADVVFADTKVRRWIASGQIVLFGSSRTGPLGNRLIYNLCLQSTRNVSDCVLRL